MTVIESAEAAIKNLTEMLREEPKSEIFDTLTYYKGYLAGAKDQKEEMESDESNITSS